MVIAATVGGAVASAAIGGIAADSASSAQENANNKAINAQTSMFNTTQQNLQPYLSTGSSASSQLSNLTGLNSDNALQSPLLAGAQLPPTMTEDQLKQTPGYQFNLSQGLESVQNAAAARGLGNSGAALKGAANYATGLADSTYQNQFNNYQTLFGDQVTNSTNQFNRLMGLSGLGESAATGLGQAATATGQGIANNYVGYGNAQAGADMYDAKQFGNALSNSANSYASYTELNKLGY